MRYLRKHKTNPTLKTSVDSDMMKTHLLKTSRFLYSLPVPIAVIPYSSHHYFLISFIIMGFIIGNFS